MSNFLPFLFIGMKQVWGAGRDMRAPRFHPGSNGQAWVWLGAPSGRWPLACGQERGYGIRGWGRKSTLTVPVPFRPPAQLCVPPVSSWWALTVTVRQPLQHRASFTQQQGGAGWGSQGTCILCVSSQRAALPGVQG